MKFILKNTTLTFANVEKEEIIVNNVVEGVNTSPMFSIAPTKFPLKAGVRVHLEITGLPLIGDTECENYGSGNTQGWTNNYAFVGTMVNQGYYELFKKDQNVPVVRDFTIQTMQHGGQTIDTYNFLRFLWESTACGRWSRTTQPVVTVKCVFYNT